MKQFFPQICVTLTLAVLGMSVAKAQNVSPSAQIDQFIESGYKTHNVKPNEPIGDELFCRRVYLDVVGRIPSREESKEFTLDTAPNKRSKLIDKLIDSEGFTSSFYNYWADILRIRTDMREEAGAAYADWVKKAIRSNMPYDKFVTSLVGAEGKIWDNGAVGYYMRDAGMPLDNMSNTAQIFLGTRVVCAQCHNHPFDKWKQRDYYEMAAFTYGVKTELDLKDIVPDLYGKMDKEQERAAKKAARNGRKPEDIRALENTIKDILMPLTYGVAEAPHDLKLPADYKEGQEGYVGAANEKIVKAKTLFGADRIDKPGVSSAVNKNTRDGLINWMCDKENPRFTTVIANRMWKRTFGVGLIEPVDDFKDDTVATNQPLMKFLTELMSREKYDLRSFLKVLYKTKTYQRAATTTEISMDQPYYYPGPVLRRMTGEQIWDSLVTFMIPNPDYRKTKQGYVGRLASMKEAADDAERLYVKNPNGAKNLIAMAKAGVAARKPFLAQIEEKQKALTAARDAKKEKEATALRVELQKLQKDADLAMYKAQSEAEKAANADAAKNTFFKPREEKKEAGMSGNMMDDKNAPVDPAASNHSASEWSDYDESYYRASELPSPAPENHFLRAFGQSERNVIENAWIDASVTQALALMNGPLFDELTSKKSMLAKTLNDAITPNERANLLWSICLGRTPTEKEKAIVKEMHDKAPQSARADVWKEIFWSILNGREFMFVQ